MFYILFASSTSIDLTLSCLFNALHKSQFFKFRLSVFVVKWNGSAGGCQSQRDMWHECEMTFRNVLGRPGKHPSVLCPSSSIAYLSPGDAIIVLSLLWAERNRVCVKAFGVPPAGIPEVKVLTRSNMTASCPMLCLARCTVNKCFSFYAHSSPQLSFFINT